MGKISQSAQLESWHIEAWSQARYWFAWHPVFLLNGRLYWLVPLAHLRTNGHDYYKCWGDHAFEQLTGKIL